MGRSFRHKWKELQQCFLYVVHKLCQNAKQVVHKPRQRAKHVVHKLCQSAKQVVHKLCQSATQVVHKLYQSAKYLYNHRQRVGEKFILFDPISVRTYTETWLALKHDVTCTVISSELLWHILKSNIWSMTPRAQSFIRMVMTYFNEQHLKKEK